MFWIDPFLLLLALQKLLGSFERYNCAGNIN